MEAIGAYDAKTHLAELLDRVARGERITITRHGSPVAMLVPATDAAHVSSDEAVDALRRFRRGITLGGGLSLRDLIQEGRL